MVGEGEGFVDGGGEGSVFVILGWDRKDLVVGCESEGHGSEGEKAVV